MNPRRLLLPLMAATLAAYAVVHSPASRAIGRLLGHRAVTCYFACTGTPNGRPLGEALAALICLVLAGWAALLLARQMRGTTAEHLVAFGLLGLALVVVPSSWAGLAGWAADRRWLAPPLGPLLTALPSLLVLALGYRRGWRIGGGWAPRARPPALVLLLGVLGFGLLLLAAVVGISDPPTGYDALSYHAPLAVYYWRDGNLGSYLERQPWAWALAHPGTAELWFGLLRVAAGERVASLGQLPFALLGAASIHLIGRRSGLPRWPAALGGLAFLLSPIVVVQSWMQLNDLAAAGLILAAMALAAAPPERWTPGRLGLVGLALGLAVTTKLAVLPAVVAVLAYLVFRLARPERRGALVAAGAAALLLVVCPWWIRNLVLFGNPIFPAALPLLGRGYVVGDFVRKDTWFVPAVWAWPLYPLVEPHDEMSGFGAVFAVAALPGVMVAMIRARRGPLALVGLVAVVSAVAWWRLTQHEPRLVLGVAGAAFAGVGWTLVAVPRRQRRAAAGLLLTAALVSAAVTVDRTVAPRLVPSGRARFYEREWGIDSTVAALPEREALFYHTGYAYRSYAGDYPLLGPSQGRVLTVIDGVLPADSIARLMRAAGARYAYVPASAEAAATVRAMYPPGLFDLVHQSRIAGKWKQTTRSLYRLREAE